MEGKEKARRKELTEECFEVNTALFSYSGMPWLRNG